MTVTLKWGLPQVHSNLNITVSQPTLLEQRKIPQTKSNVLHK